MCRHLSGRRQTKLVKQQAVEAFADSQGVGLGWPFELLCARQIPLILTLELAVTLSLFEVCFLQPKLVACAQDPVAFCNVIFALRTHDLEKSSFAFFPSVV
jgi:hypothetical protein